MTYLPGGRINATIGGNTSGAGALISSGTLTLAGGNNITLSQAGNAVTISGGAGGAAGSQTLGISNLGNSIGTSGIASGSAVRYLFAGGNNITLSQSVNGASGTVTIVGASQSLQTSNIHNVTLSGNTAGAMAQISSGTLTLAGGNNITLSQAGNAISIIGGAGGGGGIALANSQTTYSTGTANMVASGALTIASTTGQSFNFSVPQTSSLSATGALSISTNGSTISIGVPAQGTLSRFEYPNAAFSSLQTQGQGLLSLQHVYIPFNVTATAMKIGGSLSGVTNTSATIASADVSLWMGIYTLSGSTLSLASSGSANNGFQWSQSASTTANSSVNSMRQMTVPMNINLTPGEYWVGAVMSTASTYTHFSYWIYGNDRYNPSATAAVFSPIGSHTSAARDAFLFQGIYTAATSVGPVSIGGSQINNTSVSNIIRANFYFVMFNATY